MCTAAKFSPPQLSPHYFAPPAVPGLLPAVLAHRLTCLHAPAGYGKSAALRQLQRAAREAQLRTVWITPDAADNRWAQLAATLAAALDLTPGTAADDPAALLAPLAGAGPLLIILDPFDALHTPQVHAALQRLFAAGPSNVHWAVALRGSLPLRLSQLHLAQQMLVLDAAQLRLPLPQAAALLHEVSGTALDAASIEQLWQRCDGWAAGLQLAALALRGAGDAAAFAASFSGADRDVGQYLREAVLDELPARLRRFLLHSAQLHRFSAAQCRQVLGEEDAAGALAELSARGIFLSELDRSAEWFRYHPLLAGYLRHQLQSADPAAAQRLRAAASRWHEEQGELQEALDYALSAGQPARAAQLLEDCLPELEHRRGEHGAALHWIARLPPPAPGTRLALRLARARALLMCQRRAEAGAELAALEQEAGAAGPPLQAAVGALRCAYESECGNHAAAAAAARRWLERWPDRCGALDRAIVLLVQGYAAWVAGQPGVALQCGAEAQGLFDREGGSFGSVRAAGLQALALARLDQPAEAVRLLQAARTAAPGAGPAALLMLEAALAYEQDQTDQAQALLAQAWPSLPRLPFHEAGLAAYLTRARLQFQRGQHDAADACLHEGVGQAMRQGQPRMAAILQAERLHLLQRAGREDAALALAAALPQLQDGMPGSAELPVRLAMLRLRLAAGGADTARCLQELAQLARRQHHAAALGQLGAIRAACAARAGQRSQALRLLQACRGAQGWRRSVLDESPLVAELAAALDAGGQAAPAAALAPADRPSARELRILRLVEQGLKNRDMARELFVSDETIKWHLRNIYAKLQVNNRTSAVARARALALL